MKTSVLITVYERPDALAVCLAALALQNKMPDEVVVSDDGSGPATVRRIESLLAAAPFRTVFTRQDHDGYRLAAARNNAIRASNGDYIVSLDCDIALLPDAIAAHLRKARPGQFLAGNRAMLDQAWTTRLCTGALDAALLEEAWSASDRRHLGRAQRQFLKHKLLRSVRLVRLHKPKLLGCHFSLFRADAERINGFDEQFRGWGLEDDDFAMRLQMAGVSGRSVIGEARALHLWHPSVESKPRRIADSPNMAYFRRRDVAAFCERGLKS